MRYKHVRDLFAPDEGIKYTEDVCAKILLYLSIKKGLKSSINTLGTYWVGFSALHH